jgi:RNA polymerase sigma factor (sigma-70 family)
MGPEGLFRSNLGTIERVIREICRGARLRDDDAEDFASSVHVALMENDYAVLRKWEGRSSLAGYLSVVIRRLLADSRSRELGRWQPSTEASRMGTSGVLLERLLMRDGRSLEEIIPIVLGHDPALTREAIVAMAARLPRRVRHLRAVGLDDDSSLSLASSEQADERAHAAEVRTLSARASDVVRRTMAAWPDEDAMILRFHFGSSMTIAEISRMLRIPQRPLYRRMEALLAALRGALDAAGLDAAVLSSVIGEASQEMDFGLEPGKNPSALQSEGQGAATAGEAP